MTFTTIFMQLLTGFKENLIVFGLTLLMSLPLGLLISLGSMSRFFPLRWLVRGFVWVIRGTPLMLQLMIVFYVPGLVFNIQMSNRLVATLIAFVINYAAYFSEIYRGGIESISQGQYEAGYVLGMTKSQVFFKVILLQVVKRIMPSIANEVITLVKDTSLARIIAFVEIIMMAERLVSRGIVWPLFFTGVFFLVFSALLSVLFSYIEKKLSYFKG